MDTTTTWIAVVIVLLCILPIFLMNESRRRRERRGKDILKEMATKENAVLANFYIAQHFLIGISEDKQILFFARQEGKGDFVRSTFRLKDFARCTTERNEHQEGAKSDRCTMIDQVRLCLIPKQGKDCKNLIFYDIDTDGQAHSDEMKIAEEWQRILSTCL